MDFISKTELGSVMERIKAWIQANFAPKNGHADNDFYADNIYAVGDVAVTGKIKKGLQGSYEYTLPDKTGTIALLSDISMVNLYISVNSLPTASADTMGKIYLVPSASAGANDAKDEYITLRSGSPGSYTYAWEKIGSTTVDLSNYWQNSNSSAANYLVQATLGQASDAASASGSIYAMLNYYFPLS